jgi:hypothetical protein
MTIGETIEFTTGAGLSAGALIIGNAALLTQFGGYNHSAVDSFLLLFDASAAPVNGALPKISFKVPGGQSFSWLPPDGSSFTTGCRFAVSSTGDILTGVANLFYVYAKVISQA